MIRIASYALAALALTSCANISGSYKFDPSSDEGLIVGTITYDTSLGLYWLYVKPSTSAPPPKIDVGSSMWPPLTPQFDDALQAKGGTYAVAVKAGKYTVQGFGVKQGYTMYRSTVPIGIEVVVEKGKTTYLGNLHFWKDDQVSLRDKSSRDIPALKAKYEVLRSAPIAFTIAEGTEIKGLGGEFQSRTQFPIMIPIGR
jgi:hypothetical protein